MGRMSKTLKIDKHCLRCGKIVTHNPIHSCTPSPAYRAGMNEGEMIQKKLNEELQEKRDLLKEVGENV